MTSLPASAPPRPAPGWIATGLRWRGGLPSLTARNGSREHERVIGEGTVVGWVIGGPRRCTGVWAGGAHHPCPHLALIEPGATSVQCPSCQAADPGLALARDQILDDGRTYRLYLAWFGEGLLKVGLTAEERGTARLLEQGALAYTFVARGRLPGIRRAELTVARAGLARERFALRTKSGGWWGLPGADDRCRSLAELRADVLRLLAGHGIEFFADGPLVDQVDLFGLASGAPPLYRKVVSLTDGATLSGVLRAPVGRQLFVDTGPQEPPLLLDTRLLTGWTLAPAAEQTPCAGLDVQLCKQPDQPGAQDALF